MTVMDLKSFPTDVKVRVPCLIFYNTWLKMSYNNASVNEPDQPERKQGMVKNPVESVSSALPP
jgi:hypothetical protein